MKIKDIKRLVRLAWKTLKGYVPNNKSLKLWLGNNGHDTDLRFKSVWLILHGKFCQSPNQISEGQVRTAVADLLVKTKGWFHIYEIVKRFPSIDKKSWHRWLFKWEKQNWFDLITFGNCGWQYPLFVQDWGIPVDEDISWEIKYQFLYNPVYECQVG